MPPLADLLRVISIPVLLFGAAIVSNYWFLALVAVARRGSKKPGGLITLKSFAIVIPAHNEETGIGRTVRSCQDLDYPKDKYAIHVIADNCCDHTAHVARIHGVTCLERADNKRRGKGYALEYAFERIDLDRFDAVVVLDGDCVIDRHALRVFNRYLGAGAKALQAINSASNPDESATSYVLAVGNCIENELFCAPRAQLGLSVFLRGTGMVLQCDLLHRFPWRAHSIVEDVEYALVLARSGIRVHFVQEAGVHSAFPADGTQLRVQRTRWASGNLGFAKTHAVRLICEGLCRGRWTLLDMGWTLLVLSKPLVILVLLAPLVMNAAGALLDPDRSPDSLLASSLGLLVLVLGYFLLGVVRRGVTRRRLWLLLNSPGVVMKLVVISIAGLVGGDREDWARTPR
jgi:cellulose synthase/poly-beta-1,6-N-acetylglucosamine synthase-like glycosyltransferase